MILDTVLRMEASIEELKGMVVRNEWPKAVYYLLMINSRLSAPVQVQQMVSKPIQRPLVQQLHRYLRMHVIIQVGGPLGTLRKVPCFRQDTFPRQSLF
jgi:hypothetical protein